MIHNMKPEVANLDALLAQLTDADEERRYRAAYALQKIGRPVLPLTFKALSDPEPLLREMACFLLGQLEDETVDQGGRRERTFLRDGVPLLMHLLHADRVADVRAAAAAALGQQAVPEALPHLCAAAADPDENVRFDVAFALGSYYGGCWEDAECAPHQASVRQTLLKLMDDRDDDVRDWATFGIHQGGHDSPEVRERLWRALDDPYVDVRGEAATALGLFGDRGVIPILDRLLRDPDELHTGYFDAADALVDPCLLPAMEEGFRTWSSWPELGEALISVEWSVQKMRAIAARAAGIE